MKYGYVHKKSFARLHAETILFHLNTLRASVISVRSLEILESTILLHFPRKNVVVVVGGRGGGKLFQEEVGNQW